MPVVALEPPNLSIVFATPPAPRLSAPNEPVEVYEPLISPLEEIAPNNGFEVVVKCCPVL